MGRKYPNLIGDSVAGALVMAKSLEAVTKERDEARDAFQIMITDRDEWRGAAEALRKERDAHLRDAITMANERDEFRRQVAELQDQKRSAEKAADHWLGKMRRYLAELEEAESRIRRFERAGPLSRLLMALRGLL